MPEPDAMQSTLAGAISGDANRSIQSLAEAADAMVDSGFSVIRTVWFRGQAESDWTLAPRISRLSLTGSERPMLNDFEVEATRFVGRPLVSTWEVMTLAQHHRVPTRLLDWTTSLQVALHFAVEPAYGDPEKDGALYVLDPASLNYESRHKTAEVFMFGRTARIDDGTLDAVLGSAEEALVDDCFAVMSPHSFERIGSQAGAFIVIPPNSPRVEQFFQKGSFEKWTIPAEAKSSIRNELTNAGYSHYRLFPTLDSAAQDVCRRHGLE